MAGLLLLLLLDGSITTISCTHTQNHTVTASREHDVNANTNAKMGNKTKNQKLKLKMDQYISNQGIIKTTSKIKKYELNLSHMNSH